MSGLKNRAWLLLAASITLQLVVVRCVRELKYDVGGFGHVGRTLLERGAEDVSIPHQSLFALPLTTWYDQASPIAKPFVGIGIMFILAFLFSFIGITASDFFCPNLSTIASYLGLNESTAGVTFLAFGNGSPDVFSTFAALRGGTFSLAVGELIGAASFIVSIVVGTIALIRPFHVPRHAFLRDVLFFTAAVILLVTVLHDGHLKIHESGAMVGLYIAYVVVVVLGNWWNRKQKNKETSQSLGWEDRTSANRTRSLLTATTLPNLSLPETVIPNHRQQSPPNRPSSPHGSHSSVSPTLLPSRVRLGTRSQAHFPPSHDEYPIDIPRANFSLLGAVEFRDVVNSLRKVSESRGGSPGWSPVPTPIDHGTTDYFGAVSDMYSHRRSSSVGINHPLRDKRKGRQRAISHVGAARSTSNDLSPIPISPASSSPQTPIENTPPVEANPWSDQQGRPLTPVQDTFSSSDGQTKPARPRVLIPRKSTGPRVPSISITDPAGLPGPIPTATEPSLTVSPTPPVNETRFKFRRRTRHVLRVLFPSLQSFRHKSYLGMFLAVTSAPAILALTLTLPVVDDGALEEGGVTLPVSDTEGLTEDFEHPENTSVEWHDDDGEEHLATAHIGEELHRLVDGGFSPLHSPLGRISHASLCRAHSGVEAAFGQDEETAGRVNKELLEEMEDDDLHFHMALTSVQCVLGPAFCAVIILHGMDYFKWILLGACGGGAVAAGLVAYFATDGTSRTWRLVRCFAGFICSMVWIAAIADEVVSVLQAVGEILGLSDAIIGLTIFAVGNSLADLVANVTVAQFAPAMAYAACFGGPMLNILLGVGGSGTYHMVTHPTTSPVTLHFSPTLWVSASGLVLVLVATAFFVPLNGYLIDRRWACCLIVAYCVLMTINIAVEVKTGRS